MLILIDSTESTAKSIIISFFFHLYFALINQCLYFSCTNLIFNFFFLSFTPALFTYAPISSFFCRNVIHKTALFLCWCYCTCFPLQSLISCERFCASAPITTLGYMNPTPRKDFFTDKKFLGKLSHIPTFLIIGNSLVFFNYFICFTLNLTVPHPKLVISGMWTLDHAWAWYNLVPVLIIILIDNADLSLAY